MVVGIGLMFFGVAFLVSTTVKPDQALLEQAAVEHARTHWRTLWSVIVVLLLYAFVLEPLGYVIATSLFFLVVARLAGSRQPVRDIIVAVLFSLAVFFGFTEVLGVRLPEGLMDLVL
jgi:putative tricarboxylic transport membrane protein